MKKIKILVSVFLLVGLLACAGVACNDGQENGGSGSNTNAELTLTGKTEDVAYGSIYKINTIVSDSLGNKHELQYKVTTSDNEAVSVSGNRFSVVDKSGYIIEYWLEFNGAKLTKKDILTVKALGEPMITIYSLPQTIFFGEEYTIPDASVNDIYDGDLEPIIEVYKKDAEKDIKCGTFAVGDQFKATESGEYYVKISAINSASTESSTNLSFYVRERMSKGEFDDFDEEALQLQYQNSAILPQLSGIYYKDEFRGREGILHLNFTARPDNTPYITLYAKGAQADYENYDYIAITMYIEGDTESFYNPRLTNGTISERLDNVVYNAWKTYYINAQALRNTWGQETRVSFAGLPYKNCNVYIDRIYLANEANITFGGVKEENGWGMPTFASEKNENIDYTVWYEDNDAALMLKNDAFAVNNVGKYIIHPDFSSGDLVYTGEAFTYHSTEGSAQLQLNNYDEVITSEMTEYTLPQASLLNADGYKLENPKITFTDYSRETNEMSFDKTKKGVFTYEFTATKAGAKTLTAKARIKTGSYGANEVFTFSDTDALKRISARTNKNGKEILEENDVGLSGKVFHLPITVNAEYINLLPSATYEEIEQNDFIKTKIVIDGKLKDGMSYPTTKLTFGNSIFTINGIGTLNINIPSADFLKEFYRLQTIADSQMEYIMILQTTIANFEELHLYVSDIIMEKVSYEENELFTPGNGYTLTGADGYNNKTAGVFLGENDVPAGYDGVVEKISATKTVSVHSPWSLDEIKTLKTKGYVALDFKIYVHMENEQDKNTCGTSDGLIYRHSGSELRYYKLTVDTWLDFSVSIDDVIAEMEESGSNDILLLSKLQQGMSLNFDAVYVSGLTFSK